MSTILVLGNPIDGLTFIGPFDEFDDATKYAETHGLDEWHTAELFPPEE